MAGPYYRYRRATLSQAVNVVSPVNLDAEGNVAGGVLLPKGVSKITDILITIGASIVAVASSGVNLMIRLTGDGLQDGQMDIPVGSLREDTTSTSGAKIVPVYDLPVDINIEGGNTVNIGAALGGVDPGSPEIGIGLVLK